MKLPENVYAVVVDPTNIIAICTTKNEADAQAEQQIGTVVQELPLTKASGKRKSTDAAAEGSSAPKKTKKGTKNNTPPLEGIPNCMAGKSFFFVGTGMKLTKDTLGKTVINHGGTVAAKLEEAEYVITGKTVGTGQQETIDKGNLITMPYDSFAAWVDTGDEPEDVDEST